MLFLLAALCLNNEINDLILWVFISRSKVYCSLILFIILKQLSIFFLNYFNFYTNHYRNY